MGEDIATEEVDKRIDAVLPGHCATLIYTSGTTVSNGCDVLYLCRVVYNHEMMFNDDDNDDKNVMDRVLQRV